MRSRTEKTYDDARHSDDSGASVPGSEDGLEVNGDFPTAYVSEISHEPRTLKVHHQKVDSLTIDKEDTAVGTGSTYPNSHRSHSRTAGLSRPAWHFVVDVLLFLLLLILIGVSALVQFIFPPPTEAKGWSLWGCDYNAWSALRFFTLSLFAVMTIVHLMLQWGWVCSFVSSRISRFLGRRVVLRPAVRTLYGVALLIFVLTLLGALLFAAELMIQGPSY